MLLSEDELGISTIAVLPEHLVVLLDPADIVANILTTLTVVLAPRG